MRFPASKQNMNLFRWGRRDKRFLLSLIAKERWGAVLKDLRTEGGRVAASTRNEYGWLPLHLACEYDAPLEVVQALLRVHRDGASTRTSTGTGSDGESPVGNLPIHVAFCNSADLNVVTALLEAMVDGGEGACSEDTQGYTPLDRLNLNCRRGIQRALEGPGPGADGDAAQSPHDMLLVPNNKDGGPLRGDDHCLGEYWDKACCVIKMAYHGTVADPLPGGRRFRVVHACWGIERCPPDIILLSMRLHPEQLREKDEDGNYPLHIAAANGSINGRCARLMGGAPRERNDANEEADEIDLVSELVRLYPKAAEARNRDGRLPLNLAIESGKAWEEGVGAILDAAGHAVTLKDDATDLYPFMLAAAGDGGCVSTSFNLLRRCPELKRFCSE